jgi:hypothetical protein
VRIPCLVPPVAGSPARHQECLPPWDSHRDCLLLTACWV